MLSRIPRRSLPILTALAVAAATALVAPTAAVADTAPSAGTPATVSTDLLPAPQINGVAWSQVVIGDTVYVGGRFSKARPWGAAKGKQEVRRVSMLAYDVRTGVLLPGFDPRFNSEVRALAASDDGRTVYAVGNFTAVDGKRHTRIAAIDAATGAARSFKASVNSLADAVAVHGGTVYAGGQFTSASGKKRTRLAAFDAKTGSLKSWHPSANRAVLALAVSPGGKNVYLGGHFNSVNGKTAKGSARVSATTGTKNLAWGVNKTVQNNGPDAAIYSMSTDGNGVYLSGYSFHPLTKQKRLEGVVAATYTGGLRWIEDCHGDTYDSAAVSGVLYTAGHAHDCNRVGGFKGTTKPVRYNHAIAFTTKATRTLKHSQSKVYTDFGGKKAPTLLNWWPSFTPGKYTGQNQAVWTVSGDARYVVYGGEFTAVNGRKQQGLIRFAVAKLAPNEDGPRLSGKDLKPSLKVSKGGSVRVRFTADFDRDNQKLKYTVTRTVVGTATTATKTFTIKSRYYFDRPVKTYTDKGLVPGTRYAYRVTATDPFGNTASGTTAYATAK